MLSVKQDFTIIEDNEPVGFLSYVKCRFENKNKSLVELWVLEKNIRTRRFYEKVGLKPDNTYQIINVSKELKEIRYVLAL